MSFHKLDEAQDPGVAQVRFRAVEMKASDPLLNCRPHHELPVDRRGEKDYAIHPATGVFLREEELRSHP
jgi:hypothetical protein